MTPVAKTGLHCGGEAAIAEPTPRHVTPVAKTGLHCGWVAETMDGPWTQLVTPVAKTGLHCGWIGTRVAAHLIDK